MAQVFVSYSRKDNIPGIYDSNKEGIVEYHLKQLKNTYFEVTGEEINVFFDERDINIGDELDESIEKAIDFSCAMIVFVTPGYIKSNWCTKELKQFANKKDSNKKIFYFLIKKIDNDSFLQGLKQDEKYTLEKINRHLYLDLTEAYDKPESRESLHRKMLSICQEIAVLNLHAGQVATTNIHTIDFPIDNIEKLPLVNSLIATKQKYHLESKPVCVIFTGGTVGLIRDRANDSDNDDLVAARKAIDIANKVPRLRDLSLDIHFFCYEHPIDSANVEVGDWIKLSLIIESLYSFYDGFVILHGVNTMAYTASALSFMFDNLDKPIILTGSELPLVELGSDASNNIIGAIKAASPGSINGPVKISEVCILFGNNLLRGNRATKKHSISITEGFYSPNCEPIGEYKGSKLYIHNIRNENSLHSLELITYREFDKNGVFIFELYPGMNFSWFKKNLKSDNIKGVIFKSYGTGNVPNDRVFIEIIKDLIAQGTIIVNVTQCPIGQVELILYETSAKFFDMGVISGGDMTVEAAYCKLKYLIGKYGDHIVNGEAIKNEFKKNLKGELSLCTFTLNFKGNDLKLNEDSKRCIWHTTAQQFNGIFDFNDIDNSFIRLEGFQISENPTDEIPEFFIYYNRPNINSEPSLKDSKYIVANFKKNIKINQSFNKNIEITQKLKKFYTSNQMTTIQIVCKNPGVEFSLNTVTLLVYARNSK